MHLPYLAWELSHRAFVVSKPFTSHCYAIEGQVRGLFSFHVKEFKFYKFELPWPGVFA